MPARPTLPYPRTIRTHRTVAAIFLAVLAVGAIVAIWARNRDILRDLYDHSTMIAAAGKIHAGLRPYQDVRSPMQSAVYYFNWGAESLFGRTYLGLTGGGLVQSLGGAFLIAWILARRWSLLPAVIATAAIIFAGPLQHIEFFYNPIGIICLTIVLVGVGRTPDLARLKIPETWLVFAALCVSGTNKLNFHALALVAAGLLVLRSRFASAITTRACIANLVALVAAGVVAPLAFELLWTGTSISSWIDQVILGPTARYEAARHFSDWHIFVRPPYDFHHHLLVRPLGGVGLLVLLACGAWATTAAFRQHASGGDLLSRLVITGCGAIGGALLLVTNHETVALTSLTFYVFALALYLACRDRNCRSDDRFGAILLIASLVWTVTGAYAAWHGSRVLYAPNPPPRAAYERLVHAPKPLAYFEGVRFEADHLRALRALATKLETMEDARGHLSGIAFGPAAEWLERAYPEAIVRGTPIWYHHGTSLWDHDGAWFQSLMARAAATRLVVQPTWEMWPPEIATWLATSFRAEQVGDRYVIYHPRPHARSTPTAAPASMPRATEFRELTGSNVLIGATEADAAMRLQPAQQGILWAARGDGCWSWPFPVHVVRGFAVAEQDRTATTGEVVFRILATGAPGERLLWEVPVTMGPNRRSARIAFEIQGCGRPVRFEVAAPADVTAGWREIHISQSGINSTPRGLPFWPGLTRAPSTGGDDAQQLEWISATTTQEAPPGVGTLRVPFEQWHLQDGSHSDVGVRLRLAPVQGGPSETVVAALIWYRSGRFEIMTERMLAAPAPGGITLQATVPEPGGWVGLLVRPAGVRSTGHTAAAVEWTKR